MRRYFESPAEPAAKRNQPDRRMEVKGTMETQDKKPDGSPKQGRARIRLSDVYPLVLATHGCDQAVEYVLRLEGRPTVRSGR